MPYCSKQDLIIRLGIDEIIQLTDPQAGSVNDDTINRAITDAEATINGYLQVRYTLPIVIVPTFLTRLACEIARYLLHDHPPEDVSRRYEAAIKSLEAISKGLLTLDLEVVEDGPEILGSPEIVAGERVFTRESTQGF